MFLKEICITLFFLCASLQMLYAQDQLKECADLWRFFEQSHQELAQLEKVFLQKNCQEEPSNEDCKKLAPAIREIQGALTMLASRIEVQKCEKNHQEKPMTQTPCSRMQALLDKTLAQLKAIDQQMKAYGCDEDDSPKTCQSLKKSMIQPTQVKQAALRQMSSLKCESPKSLVP